jgi:hypothetical protein
MLFKMLPDYQKKPIYTIKTTTHLAKKHHEKEIVLKHQFLQ